MVEPKKLLKDKLLVSVVVSVILLAIVGIFIGLSYYITYIGAGIFVFAMILYLIRILAYKIVFAGSSSIWRRSFESNFCYNLCNQGVIKIERIMQYIENLINQEKFISNASLKSSGIFISQVMDIFDSIETSKNQQILNSYFRTLHSTLLNTMVEDRNGKLYTMWFLILNPEQIRKAQKIQIEAFGFEIISQCEKIIGFFKEHSQISKYNILFKGNFVLGDFQYQRADFLNRFQCEQFFLVGDDSKKIDCVYLDSQNSESRVLAVYCCPNGGFYEYIYYQTDWIEFYIEAGISIVLWNYRSYGRSEGSPTLPRLCRDGEILINYFRNSKFYNKIIVHGESLGGSIATKLAVTCNCDLLVADRTFSSLYTTYQSYVGTFMAWILTIIGPGDIDVATHFLEFPNYKILTCDPKDTIIDDSASLKSGIAKNKNFCSKISEKLFEEFYQALKKINIAKKNHSYVEKPKRKGYKIMGKKTVYKTLNTEEIEHGIEYFVVKFLEIADKVDACGINLVEILEKDKASIKNWVSNLEIWGSCPSSFSLEEYDLFQSAIIKIQQFSYEVVMLLHEFSDSELVSVKLMTKEINVCLKFFLEIISVLEEKKKNKEEIAKFIVLECGHGGSYTSIEKFVFDKLLKNSGIFA